MTATEKKEKNISSIYLLHIIKAWTDKDKSHQGRGGLLIIWLCFILLNKHSMRDDVGHMQTLQCEDGATLPHLQCSQVLHNVNWEKCYIGVGCSKSWKMGRKNVLKLDIGTG